jgi:hypothetical protein
MHTALGRRFFVLLNSHVGSFETELARQAQQAKARLKTTESSPQALSRTSLPCSPSATPSYIARTKVSQ